MRRILALYPVLIGLFFVLALYSYNMPDVLSLGEVVGSLLVVVAFSLVCLGIARVCLGSWDRASLVVACLVVFVLSYGYAKVSVGMDLNFYLVAGLSFLVVVSLLVLRVFRTSILRILTVVGSCISGGLVLVVLISIGMPSLGPNPTAEHIGGVSWMEVSSKPDIYYLIFDKYTSQEVLGEYLGYDNSEFLDSLRQKGFVVNDNAYSNYASTRISEASSLNMQYWTSEDLNMKEGQGPLLLLNDNEVFRILKAGGYRCIYLGNWHPPTSLLDCADLNLVYGISSEFPHFLLESSIFFPLADQLFGIEEDRNLRARETTLFQFETLMKMPSLDGPKFVFATILLPHEPYVFQADGSMPPDECISMAASDMTMLMESYLTLIEFANMKIIEVVDTLLEDSVIPPIIILQAEEGMFVEEGIPYWGSRERKSYQEVSAVTPRFAKWSLGILDAKYLPRMPLEESSKLKSPVNTFRGIFNYYFGAEYELLPDKYYFMEKYRYPYIPLDITEEVLEWMQEGM